MEINISTTYLIYTVISTVIRVLEPGSHWVNEPHSLWNFDHNFLTLQSLSVCLGDLQQFTEWALEPLNFLPIEPQGLTIFLHFGPFMLRENVIMNNSLCYDVGLKCLLKSIFFIDKISFVIHDDDFFGTSFSGIWRDFSSINYEIYKKS